MNLKRMLSMALSTALLCTLLVFPSASAAQSSSFSDITDPSVAQAAEILKLLGIVEGTGSGQFQPSRTLSRAEFCKMAVELMGSGDKVAANMNRTIFKDVPATHWARGYIYVATNVTTTGGDKATTTQPGIIRGDPYGNFYPDRAITYAEAVTILVRILGYSDSDVGLIWPDGYLATAKNIGLTDSFALDRAATLTRGQSAELFLNLLYTKMKGADGKEFLTTLGVTTAEEPVLILAVDAEAPDGTPNAIKTKDGKIYKTDRFPFDASLVGRMGKLVLDKDSKVLDITLSDKGSTKTVNLVPGELNNLKTSTGDKIKIDPKTVVWQNSEETTYEKVWQKLRSGTQALLQYSNAGELEYVFLTSSAKASVSAMVAKNKPSGNPFGALAGGQTGYAIYKNGVPAAADNIRQYDVATFDKGANVLYVSDLRLTGVFENAYPNPDNPVTVTVMGRAFPVLDSAISDLAAFKIGDVVTLLLTYDCQVAGVVDIATAKSTTVGTVKIDAGSGEATVTPIMDLVDEMGEKITLTGTTSYTGRTADQMQGQLVTVSSNKVGRLNISRISNTESGVTGKLDMATGKIGSVALAENVKLYERVGTSEPKEIELRHITRGTVPSKQILYVHKDYAGKADIVIFDDVTGDRYAYGITTFTPGENSSSDSMSDYVNATLKVENASGGFGPFICGNGSEYRSGQYGGIVASLDKLQGNLKLANSVTLTDIKDVASTAFNTETQTVSVGSTVYPISDYVQCYNKTTKTWFKLGTDATVEDHMAALDKARAFASTLTIYIDKAPEDGGKVRLVIVE